MAGNGLELLIVSHVRVSVYEGKLYLQGGFGRHVDAFARRFDRVRLLTCARRVSAEPDDYRLREDNITLIPVPPFARAGRVRRYASMLVAASVAALKLPAAFRASDVIHPRLPSAVGGVGALLSRLSSKPVFLYLAGDWEGSLLARGDSPMTRFLARCVRGSLGYLVSGRTVYTAGARLARKVADSAARAVPLMTTAIDKEHVVSLEDARRRAGRPPRELLFVGLVWRMKGIFVLLEALRLLRDRGVPARLRVVGRAADGGAELMASVGRLGLESAVVHEPHMAWDRLIESYEASDIFVMPSLEGRGEGVPKVVLEAMARGVPVVATDVGGVSALVEHGRSGWLVPPGSPEDLAVGIERLWHDSGLRSELAATGLEAASRHDLDGLIDAMLEGIEPIRPLSPPPPPPAPVRRRAHAG